MIARLSGTVLSRRATEVILDVGGVGYRIHAPTSTIEKLPQEGKQAVLHTHLHVREDAMQMYGFVTEEALSVFETMLAVSGVGPKLALAALSAMTPSELRASVTGGDAAMLTRIPGVGRKTAERMILELRDRFAALDGTGLSTCDVGRHVFRRKSVSCRRPRRAGLTRIQQERSGEGASESH
jgi:holliday junction DNA helicase RuvA